MPATAEKPSSTTVPTVDASARPGDAAAHAKAQAPDPQSFESLGGVGAIAGSGRTPDEAQRPAKSKSPVRNFLEYAEPPGSLEESMQQEPEIQGDKPPGGEPAEPEETPSSKPKAKSKRDDNELHKAPDDTLEALQELAGAGKKKKDEPIKPAADPAPDPDGTESLTTLKQVRAAHKEQLKHGRELEAQVKDLNEKIKTHEKEPGSMAHELEDAQAKITAYENKLQTVAYTQSNEFHDNHVKPLEKALTKAISLVKELSVEQEDGTIRQGTERDFQQLLRMDPSSARKAAKAMFGDDHPEVIDRYRTVRELDQSRHEAMEGADVRAQEAINHQQAQLEKSRALDLENYAGAMTELQNKYSDLFADREDDAEANKLTSRQRTMIKQLIDDDQMPQDQKIKLSARIHQQAANYPKVLLDLKRSREEVESLKEQLNGFEGSEPGERGGGGGGARSEGSNGDETPDPMKALEALGARRK